MLGNKNKRILALALSAAMLLSMASLTSCKKTGGEDSGAGAGGTGNAGSNGIQAGSDMMPDILPTSPDGTPHGDYVLETDPFYSDTMVTLTIPDNENKDRDPERKLINETCFLNAGVACSYFRTYKLTSEEEAEMRSLDVFDPDELMRYYELLMIQQESGILIYSTEGETITNIELPAEDEVYHLYPLKDGSFIASVFHSDYSPSGDGGWEYDLLLISDKGEILRNQKSDPLLDLEVGNMNVLQLDNGQYLFYGDQQVYLVDENWAVQKKTKLEDYNSTIVDIEGRYYELIRDYDYSDSVARPDYKYRELDLDSFSFSDAKALDGSIPESFRLYQDNGTTCTDDGEGLVRIDLLTGERENILRWGDTDIYGTRIERVRVTPDGDILLLSGNHIIHLHKEATNPYAGRRILKVGINQIDEEFYPLVNAYNKHPESLGRVYVYFPDGNPYGYDAALKSDAADRLLLDMKSGDGPDILLNYSEYGQFNKDEILVDLNQYIDGESGLDRSMYYDNIFRAFEDDGKLYQMPMTVFISALVGNPDVLGNINGWTNDEFRSKMQTLPDGMNPILYDYIPGNTNSEPLDGTGLLLNLLYHDMTNYVDYEKEEVFFDSDDFRELLEIARLASPQIGDATLRSLEERYYDSTLISPLAMLVQDGVCAMTPMQLYSLWDFDHYVNLCKGEAVFVGWPTIQDVGVAASAITSIGISAFSGGKDEAWDFVKFILSEETMNSIIAERAYSGISVCRESQALSVQNEIDGFSRAIEPYSANPSYAATIPVLNREIADKYLGLVERISSKVCKNPTIMEIVREEVPAYFDGSKTAHEVSKIIQSRASMLIAENG
ncbi:MAG: extracellular solute-binding protein [Clostridiales bacterium]|nr:extracellular solute-binding protein [Clostridiales bacterium]